MPDSMVGGFNAWTSSILVFLEGGLDSWRAGGSLSRVKYEYSTLLVHGELSRVTLYASWSGVSCSVA